MLAMSHLAQFFFTLALIQSRHRSPAACGQAGHQPSPKHSRDRCEAPSSVKPFRDAWGSVEWLEERHGSLCHDCPD